MTKIQIKSWLLKKNGLHFCGVSSDVTNHYRYTPDHLFTVIKETEKAYLIITDKKGDFWIPKSQVVKVVEIKELTKEQQQINEDIRELEYNVRNITEDYDKVICEGLFRKINKKHILSEEEKNRVNDLIMLVR